MTVEEVIEILEYDANKINNPTYQYKKDALKMAIEALKAEPKRGKWVNGKCSECGGDAPLTKVFYRGELMWEHKPMRNFCPMCGAKMDNTSTNSVDMPTGYTNRPTNEVE